jgi:hypothetical protein
VGVTATSNQNIVIGAGDLFYKDDAGVWAPAGATAGDDIFAVTRTYYAPTINGLRTPLAGTDYISKELVSLKCQFLEITAGLLGLLIPDSASSGGVDPALVGGGAVGVLADAIVPGQSAAIKVSSITGLTVGDFIRAGVGSPYIEFRKVTRVGTVAIGGTGIDVDFPFVYPHAVGAAFAEVDGDGTTLITSGPNRRLPSSAYRDFFLYVPGLDGRDTRFTIFKGIATGPADFTASDTKESAPQLTIEGRMDPTALYRQPWQIQKLPSYLVS